MAGKFLQVWSLRTVCKTVAVIVIVTLSVAMFATREIPDSFEGDKEWKFWRNVDFAVGIASLAFASVLLYGSITEFRAFLLAWMIWNVLFTAFWIVFLTLKYNELEDWERTFRLVAIVVLALAEIPVLNYFRYLRVKVKDVESNFSWMSTPSDQKVYKTLSERPSIASINSVFAEKINGSETTPGVENPGFRQDSRSNSTISIASEEMENKDEKQEESDVQSQTSFEISATVHSEKPTEVTESAREATESREESSEAQDFKASDESSTKNDQDTIEDGTSSDHTEDESRVTTDTESEETNSETTVSSSMKIPEESNAESLEAKDCSVVIEVEKDHGAKSSNEHSSIAVEIDVTDTTSNSLDHTSF